MVRYRKKGKNLSDFLVVFQVGKMKIMGEISKIAGGALKIYSKRGSSLPTVRKVDPIRRGLKL